MRFLSPGSIVFDEMAHSYAVEGQPVGGTTAYIEAVYRQFDGVPSDDLIRKRDLGIAVHAWCELDDLGQLDGYGAVPELVKPRLEAWRTYKREMGFTPCGVELLVFSKRYRFCGRVDAIGMFAHAPDRLAVVDRKVVRRISPATRLQTAGYLQAARETFPGEPIELRAAVQLCEDGRPRMDGKGFYDDPSDLGVFLSCVSAANFGRNVGLM